MVCGNFILPEPASYVFFYVFSFLRNLSYIITDGNVGKGFCCLFISIGAIFECIHQEITQFL